MTDSDYSDYYFNDAIFEANCGVIRYDYISCYKIAYHCFFCSNPLYKS